MKEFAQQAANRIEDWKYRTQHVQNDIGPGEFTTSATTLLCFGPPSLSSATEVEALLTREPIGGGDNPTGIFYPVGVTENINQSQNKAMQKIYEIGSFTNYTIPGYVDTAFSIARVFYHGPSLLRVMYAYYKQSTELNFPDVTDGYNDVKHFEGFSKKTKDLQNDAGYNGFWMNLASDMMDYPFGALLLFYDTRQKPIGAVFLEECYVTSHNMSLQANTMVLAEQSNITAKRVVPVKTTIK